nr:atherin [Globicephala melas]
MPPRAPRRAAAAAPLRLRAPPPRSAGLKPDQLSAPEPHPTRRPLAASGAASRPPVPAPAPPARLPLGPAARSSPLGLTPGVPRADHADWSLGLHSQPPYLPRIRSRPGGAAATWGVARGWHWDRTPSRPGCVGPTFPRRWRLRARRVPRSKLAEFSPVTRPCGQRRWRGWRAPGGARVPRSSSAPRSSFRRAAAGGPGFPRVSAAASGRRRGSPARLRRGCSPRPPRLPRLPAGTELSSALLPGPPRFPSSPFSPPSATPSTSAALRDRRARAESDWPRLHASHGLSSRAPRPRMKTYRIQRFGTYAPDRSRKEK